MAGAAERALRARERDLIDDLRALTDGVSARYATSSAFRFAYDRTASRDLADVSAVARRHEVLLRAVTEQDLEPPGGAEPGTVQPVAAGGSAEAAPTGPTAAERRVQARVARSTSAGAGSPGSGASTPAASGQTPTTGEVPEVPESGAEPEDPMSLPSAEALLSVPTTVAGRERAEQACRALANGWYEEAEELFLDGVARTPTDPFVWFGAGLAAARLDPDRAADHFARTSRYLANDDESGSAYAAILAAVMKERAGNARQARELLERRLDELDTVCPAISLHLARLGANRQTRATEAVTADPMLDADVAALGIELSEETVKDRRRRTDSEIGQLHYAIGELRKVAGRPTPLPTTPPPTGVVDLERLSLIRGEVQLWRRVIECEQEIVRARRAVDAREAARRAKERELVEQEHLAGQDLLGRTALAYFVLSVAIAIGVILTFAATRSLSVEYPRFAVPIELFGWLIELGLFGLAVAAFTRAWWPHRHYTAAREAKRRLPRLRAEVDQHLEDEFQLRRRHRHAGEAAELRIERIVGRRSFLVPRRPAFLSADLPLVPARS